MDWATDGDCGVHELGLHWYCDVSLVLPNGDMHAANRSDSVKNKQEIQLSRTNEMPSRSCKIKREEQYPAPMNRISQNKLSRAIVNNREYHIFPVIKTPADHKISFPIANLLSNRPPPHARLMFLYLPP